MTGKHFSALITRASRFSIRDTDWSVRWNRRVFPSPQGWRCSFLELDSPFSANHAFSFSDYSFPTMKWPICGPKLSLCCSVISVWGIVQFVLLGIFFFVEAAPLLDDFEFNHNTTDINVFKDNLSHAYHQRAYNCWIAAFLYVALLLFAGVQFRTNMKRSSTPAYPTSVTSPFAGVTTEENGLNQPYGVQMNGDHQ